MGLFDKLKDVAEIASYPARKPLGAAKIIATPVTKPTAWAWGKTVGEWGDRDYTPMQGADLEAARELQAGQQDLLFGQPAESFAISPRRQAILDYVASKEDVEPRSRLHELIEMDRQAPGFARLQLHREGYDVGGTALSEQVWGDRINRRIQERAQRDMEKEIVGRLESDWEKLLDEQADLGEIEDWKTLAQSVVQVAENAKDPEGNVTDQKMWEGAQAVLNQHYEALRPHIEIVAPGWWDENFQFEEGYSAFGRTARGVAAPILEAFEQIARHQISGIENIKLGLQELAGGEEAISWGDIDWRGDKPGRSSSFREAVLGKDQDWGGEWGTILDLAVEIGIDPLTYLTVGQSSTVKASLQSTARQAIKAGGDEALKRHASYWQVIKEEGFKALDEVGRLEMESWIRKDAVEIAAQQGRTLTGKAREALSRNLKSEADKIAKIEQKIVDKVARGGKEGLHAGGQTLFGLQDIPGLSRLKTRGVFEDVTELRDMGRTATVRRPGEDIFETTTETTTRAVPDPESTIWRQEARVEPGPVRGAQMRDVFEEADEAMARAYDDFDAWQDDVFRNDPDWWEANEGRFEQWADDLDNGRPVTVTGPDGVEKTFDPRPRKIGKELFEEVDETLDPRIAHLRAKAESTPFASEADAFMRKADELADKLRTGAAPHQEIRYLMDWIQEASGVRYVDDTITSTRKVGTTWIDEVIPVLDERVYRQLQSMDPGWARRVAGSVPGLRQRFIPQANLIGSIGKAHSRAVRSVIVEGQGMANEMSLRVKERLTGKRGKRDLEKAARAEMNMSEEQFMRALNEALADPNSLARLRVTGGDATGQLLDALEDIRREIWDTLDDTLKDELRMLGTKDTYIPRVMTDEGRKFLETMSDADLKKLKDYADKHPGSDANSLFNLALDLKTERAAATRQKTLKDAFTEARSIRSDIQDLFKLNEEVAKWFDDIGIKAPEDLFHNDVLAAWSTRANSAYRAKMINDVIAGMAELSDETGERIAVHMNDVPRTGSGLLLPPTRHNLGNYYLHPDLVTVLEDLNTVLLDPRRLDDLGKASDAFQSIWARYATLSPGFHARNMLGNAFNAFLGGLTNPVRYFDAAVLQRKQYAIRQLMRKQGLSWDDAVRKLNVDPRDSAMLQSMQTHRIASGTVGDVFKDRSLEQLSAKELFDWRSQSGLNPTTWSRNFGTMIEHNSRMAMYIDAIEKGMAPAQAAAHVKEFLFDYDELTPFEQNVRRHLSRFYTFMRKNTALQAQMLVKNPGRIANATRIVEAGSEILFGAPEDADYTLPAWAEVAGMKIRPGGDAVAFETPFHTAANTVEDVMALPLAIAEISGVPLDKLPDSVQDALLYNNVQDRMGQVLGLFSGLPKSVMDFMYGQTTGYDPFTGAIVGYDNPRATDNRPNWLTLLGVANPMVDRTLRWKEDIELIASGEQDLSLTLWNIFGGAMVYEDEKIHRSAVNTLQRNMEEFLRQLGDDKMSLDDLRREGQIDYVNRFMHIMTYGGVDADGLRSGDELANELAGLIPKEILEYYSRRGQIAPSLVDDREYSTELRPTDDMERAIRALPEVKAALEELLGRPLSQAEEINLILTSDMAPYMSELESYGIEPFRDYADVERNVFTRDQFKEERDDRVRSTINALGASFNINFDTLLANRPMLSEVDRVVEQARLSGASEEEVFQYLVEESSRLDINVMFGKDALSEWAWMGFGERQAAQQINAAWEDRAKFIWLYEYVNGRAPSQAEIDRAVAHMNISRTDQRYLVQQGMLSDLGPYPPSRENLQPKAEQQQDAVRELEAVLEGARGNRYMGLYPEADPRESIQLGGADFIYGADRFRDAPGWRQTN